MLSKLYWIAILLSVMTYSCTPLNDSKTYSPEIINKHPLFQYFEINEDKKDWLICGEDVFNNKGKIIPKTIASRYRLYQFEQYDLFQEYYNLDDSQVNILALESWLHQDKAILVYHINIDGDMGGTEIRLLIFDLEKGIQKNVLLAGYVYDDGENFICRRMKFTTKGVELLVEERLHEDSLPYHQLINFGTKDINVSKGHLLSIESLQEMGGASSIKEGLEKKTVLKLNLTCSKFVSAFDKDITADFCKLEKLQWVSFSRYNMNYLPKGMDCLKDLQYLNIDTNPNLNWEASLEKLATNPYLKILDLSTNQMEFLPDNIQELKSLKVLKLIDNKFSPSEQTRIRKMLPDVRVRFSYED